MAHKHHVETLTEYAVSDCGLLTVDREAGVIRNVKVHGLESRNGRTYLREAVAKARSMYEGAKVNLNHRPKPGQARIVQERFGLLKDVREGADGGLFADLHFPPGHSYAEQCCFDAKNATKGFGLSHDVIGRTGSRNGKTVVEEIVSVTSVDLVDCPATTTSLFESENQDVELQEQVDALTTERDALKTQVATLTEQVDGFKANEAKAAKAANVTKLIAEAKIPDGKVPASLRTLLEQCDEAEAKKAITDLAEQLKTAAGNPKSVAGTPRNRNTDDNAKAAGDAKEFASLIRG